MARKRTWVWFLVVFLLAVALLWIATRAINRVFLGAGPGLAERNVLEVDLVGSITERPVRVWGSRPVGPLTVHEIDTALRRAADDERIVGALLRVGPLTAGFAKIQEIRHAVEAFRAGGKPVVALLELGTLADLYAAGSASTIVQVPTGSLFVGLVSRRQYYRGLLDTLGIEFEVVHTGPYKTAMNSFTETGMTPAEREVLNSLADSLWGQIVDDLAANRDLERAQVRTALDRGLLDADAAREAGLVDELGFLDRARELLDPDAPPTDVRDYLAASGDGGWFGDLGRPVVAVVHVDGMLLPGEVGDDPFGGADVAGGGTIARHVREARQDEDVRAMLLRLDTPGGATTAADVIWREVALAAERMPVVITMSDVAASGGYWIATAGTRVLADRATYTGSIGVVVSKINLVEAYDKLGIANDRVMRGDNADLLLDSHRLEPEQRAILEATAESTYRTFIGKVAEARGMSDEEVEALAAGRVWTGSQALEVGLVDEIGGFREAIETARREAGIPPQQGVRLRLYPEARSVFDVIGGLLGQARGPSLGIDERGLLAATRSTTPAYFVDAASRRTFLHQLLGAGPVWALWAGPLPAPAR